MDGDCLEEYCKLMAIERGENPALMQDIFKDCPYASQVFIHEIHAKEAAGPTWARGLLSKHIEVAYKKGDVSPQDHCMSLDSHMDFEPEFDEKMVEMWDDALNEYAVLSTYVQDVAHLGEEGDMTKKQHQVPHLCMVKFTTNVRTDATKCVNNLSKPKLTNAVWGAGLSFSKCHAELKVMVDPHTPHIFDGEEFNRSARFWTYGYDVYTPNHVYVLHDYTKSQSNPVMHTWYQNRGVHGSEADSNKRLRTMIDLPNGEQDPVVALRMKRSKFGLGDRRSLDELINFSGFDLRHMKPSIDGKNRCGNIQWVPFTEHPKGVNYIPNFDNETEDPLDLPYEPTSVWYTSVDEKKGDVLDEEDSAGLPANSDLGKQHASLQEEVEAGELVMNGLGEKHEELLKQMREAEEVEAEEVEADEVEAEIAQDLNAPVAKEGPLRGIKQLREKAHIGAQAVSGYLAKNPLPVAKIEHGFNHLPPFVKCNIFILVLGVICAIIRSSGTGRAFKRNNTKRNN